MKLRTAILGLLLATTAPSAVQAAPIAVAIVAAVGLTGIAATVGTVLLEIAFSILTSVLINALFGKPNQQRQAAATELQLGETPRAYIPGKAAVGGTLADAFNWGGDYGTDYEAQIIILADHKCDSLVGFYVNDNFIAYPPGGWGGAGIVPDSGGVVYAGQLNVIWFDGSATQTLPSWVTNGGWSATGNFDGISIAVVAYKADNPKSKNPVWSGGRPQFLWVVKGKKCYDPRADSTVPGGSGTQRWSDPSTWVWTDNAAICRYNWVRGIYALDQVDNPDALLIGRGLSNIEAPDVNVFAYANLCDEAVPLLAGGTEPRYRANGVIFSNEKYVDTERTWADAMGGIIIQPGGSVEVEPGHARSTTFDITDDDLIVGSKVSYSSFRSVADNAWANTIVPRYVEPTQKWQDHAAPVRRVLTDVAADSGAREVSLSLAMVTDGVQAQRLGEIQRRLARLVKTATLTLGPRFGGIEEGDWGTWTSDRHLNGETITFRVEAYKIDEKRQVTVTLREIESAVYDWTAATDEIVSDVASTPTTPPSLAANFAYGAPGLLSIELIAHAVPDTDLSITAASSGAVTINTHHEIYSDSSVSVTGATITGGWSAGNRVFVYYDDPSRAGGAVTYHGTLVQATARPSPANSFRHYLGWVVIPGSGTATAGIPTIPTGLAATAGSAQVALAWTASPTVEAVLAYEVWRAAGTGTAFGSAAQIATVTALNYTDTGLPASTGYTYFLKAVNVIGASTNTAGVNATTSASTAVAFASAAEIQAGTVSTKTIAPDQLTLAHAPQTLTDGATIAWNMAIGFNAKVTLGGNRTLATPTNPHIGLTYALEIIQDGTGSRTLTWPSSSIVDWGSAAAPTLSTAAGKRDVVFLYCYDAGTPSFRASFNKSA